MYLTKKDLQERITLLRQRWLKEESNRPILRVRGLALQRALDKIDKTDADEIIKKAKRIFK